MIRVSVTKQSNFPVSSPKIKNNLRSFFANRGIVSDAEVSISFVGEKRMLLLARKYLHEKGVLHSILSFPTAENEKEFVYPPDMIIHLGEIVICYPKAFEEAKRESKLIDEKVMELVEHGAAHLMGENHGE